MTSEYTPNFMQDDEEQNKPAMVPSAPGTGPAVPSTSALASPNTQRKASTGFTNLKKYIQANKGNKLAETVVKPADSKLQQTQQTLNKSQEDFQTNLANQKSKIQATQEGGQKALGYIETGANPLIVQPTISPLEVNATEEQKTARTLALKDRQTKANQAAQTALQDVKDLRYSGPTEMANQNEILNQRADLQDFAKATQSEVGRGAILQSLFGKGGNYSAGSRNLDNALLGADQVGLQKLKDIRNQTQKIDQNLRDLNAKNAAAVGSTVGQIGTTQALQKSAMQQLRDRIAASLENQARQYNKQSKEDISSVSDEELLKGLTEAGYTTEASPVYTQQTRSTNGPRVGGIVGRTQPIGATIMPGAESSGPRIGETADAYNTRIAGPGAITDMMVNREVWDGEKWRQPTAEERSRYATKNLSKIQLPAQPINFVEPEIMPQDPAPGNWVNLFKNTQLDSTQRLDPNLTVSRSGMASASPNTSDAFIEKSLLKPLIKESYADNTWDSIDADALERRNVLSQVLADNVEKGLMTPKQKNEIQQTLDQELLTQLKGVGRYAQDLYTNEYFGQGIKGKNRPEDLSADGTRSMAPDRLDYDDNLAFTDAELRELNTFNNNGYGLNTAPTPAIDARAKEMGFANTAAYLKAVGGLDTVQGYRNASGQPKTKEQQRLDTLKLFRENAIRDKLNKLLQASENKNQDVRFNKGIDYGK